MDSPTVIAGILTLAVGLVIYSFVAQRPTDRFAIGENAGEKPKGFMRFVSFTSAEIYSSLPADMARNFREKPAKEVERLLQRSGNPWNLQANEFGMLRIVFALMGLMAGFGLGLLMNNFSPLQLPILVWLGFGGLFGYYMPKMKYTSAAKQRDVDFKRQLPDALDLLIISLAAGVTFPQALRESLPNMRPGVLKEEFTSVSRSLSSGKTLHESLNEFAKKSPSESITAFVRALQEATELNVPLVEVLESRADASRKEYFALLQEKTAALESKLMAVLTPTLIPALLLLVIAPSIASMMDTMGAGL